MSARTYCDNCTSSDGLATYPSGTYCFSCNKYSRTKGWAGAIETGQTSLPAKKINLAAYDKNQFSAEQIGWLLQYYMSQHLLDKYELGSLNGRLVLPILNQQQQLIGRQLRGFVPNRPKYISEGVVGQGGWGLPLWQSPISPSEPPPTPPLVVLTEDLLSMMRVSCHAAAVACLGTTVSPILRVLLWKYVRETNCPIVIWFDPDKAGKEKAGTAYKELKQLADVDVMHHEKQPKECTDAELRKSLFHWIGKHGTSIS